MGRQIEQLTTLVKEDSNSFQRELTCQAQHWSSKLDLLRECCDGLQVRFDEKGKESSKVLSGMDTRIDNVFGMLTTLEGELAARVQGWAADAEILQRHADIVQSCVTGLEESLNELHVDVADVSRRVSGNEDDISSFEAAFSGCMTVMMAAAFGMLKKSPKSPNTVRATLMASALRALITLPSQLED